MNAAKHPVTTASQASQGQFLQDQSLNSQGFEREFERGLVQGLEKQRLGTQNLDPEARRSQRSAKRVPYSGMRQAIAFESSVKLTVNLLLSIVATTTIAKLVPYYQSQQRQLTTLEASVEVAEQKNAELRSQFDRNFDPAQASRIMQEQSGMSYPNQKQVIWTTPPQNTLQSPSSSQTDSK